MNKTFVALLVCGVVSIPLRADANQASPNTAVAAPCGNEAGSCCPEQGSQCIAFGVAYPNTYWKDTPGKCGSSDE
jgi:hypothetical protein